MADANVRKFYVSWVDRRKDPWPRWLEQNEGQAAKKGKAVAFRPLDDPQWPGIPEVVDSVQPWQHLGPTLTALFHPQSPYHNFNNLQRIYLLYEPELGERSPHEKLQKALERICAARKIGDLAKRVHWIPIAGITEHTDHKQVIQQLEAWFHGLDDPLNLRRKSPPSIVINLSPATPTKHACWLMLYWKGALGHSPGTFVKFIQGSTEIYTDENRRHPVHDVPIDMLSRFIGKSGVASAPREAAETKPADWVKLEELRSEPYEKLRQMLEQTALLGIPIVLYGERGTGKTFLARYYHERRQFYRRHQGALVRPARPTPVRFPSNPPSETGEGNFVPVTLSEYADLHELRDNLFGWAEGSWTGAKEEYHGLLGLAHRGTLFLDEIHHLDHTLQASLLGVLNNCRYRPKMAPYEVESHFDLVLATNDPQWRDTLADDFRDRIERVVLEVPSFRSLQRYDLGDLWQFWEFTMKRRCWEAGIEFTEIPEDCRLHLAGVFRHQPLLGNWRDLMRLGDQVLLLLTAARGGRPTALTWNKDHLEKAIFQTFRGSR